MVTFDKKEDGKETLTGREGQSGQNITDGIRDVDKELLSRMVRSATPIVRNIGINMLRKGKQDLKGEIYDPVYYPGRMIILGKALHPAAFRPDNPNMPVTDQFCVLSEEGELFELMYSFDGFLNDSYLKPLDLTTALEHYGFDIIFMLLETFEKVITYIFSKEQ